MTINITDIQREPTPTGGWRYGNDTHGGVALREHPTPTGDGATGILRGCWIYRPA
ncbi:MAG: hypothetical protein LH679_24925 [Cyanobacteria bacterium CAN_BIN43]|nr:hypothetical protein [Cyanobacteria bacterium CAN_BIN43]